MIKAEFWAPLLESSVSHDPSEIILMLIYSHFSMYNYKISFWFWFWLWDLFLITMYLGHFHVNPSEEVQRPTGKVRRYLFFFNPVCFDCDPESCWVLTEDVLPALSAPVPVQRSSQKFWSMWQSTWEIWSSAYGRTWRLLLNTVSLMNHWFHEESLTSMESFHSTKGSLDFKMPFELRNIFYEVIIWKPISAMG